MLRTLFVLGLAGIGLFYAVQGPFRALLFYLWYAYFRPDLWAWSEAIRGWNPSFYLGAWVVALTLLSRHKLKFDLHVALIAGFLLQALLCAQLSSHTFTGMLFTRNLATRLLIAYLIAVLVTDAAKLRLLLLVMGLSLAFEGAKQGWAEMILRPGLPHTAPMPFLGDNNAVALGMLMVAPVLAVLARTTQRHWVRYGLWFLTVGVIYRALATYSRGALVAATALAGVYWLRSTRRSRSLLLVGAVAVPLLLLMPDAFWDRMGSTFTYQEDREHSALGRLHFWQVALEMADDRPWVGVGPGAYSREYDLYDRSLGDYGSERVPHSSWFGVLAEQGYPGVALYLGIYVLAFVNCRRVRRRARDGLVPEELGLYAAAVEAGLVVFVVGSSFISLPEMEMPYHFIGLSMALRALASAPTAGSES